MSNKGMWRKLFHSEQCINTGTGKAAAAAAWAFNCNYLWLGLQNRCLCLSLPRSFDHPNFSCPVGLSASSSPRFSLRGVNGRRQEPGASRCYGDTSHIPGDRVASATSGGQCRGIQSTQSSCPLKSRTALAPGSMGGQRFMAWDVWDPALTAGSGPGEGDPCVWSFR